MFSHTASAHALRFSAVTSDLRVSVRKADVEAATAALARDIAESSRQRRFMCRVCNFEDAAMAALKAHLKTHTDDEKVAAKKKIRQQAQQAQQAAALRIKTEAVEPPVESTETASGQQVREGVPEGRAVSPPPPPPPQSNNAGKKLIPVSAAKPRVEEQPKKADATAAGNKPDEPEIVFRCSKCSFKASSVVDIKNHKTEEHPKKDKKKQDKNKKKGGTEKGAVKTIKFAARKKVANAKGVKDIKKEADEVPAPTPAPPPPPPPILQPPKQQSNAAATAASALKEPTLYRCKICLFRAPTANDVKIHLREAHPNRKSLLRTMNNLNNQKSGPTAAPVKPEPGAAAKKVMKCTRCEFSTTALPAMRQHTLTTHPTQERQDAAKCHVCDHQAATAAALQLHAKSVHLDPATGVYACRLCTFSSSYFKPLNKHAETYVHENEDPLGTSGDPLALATSEEADPLALNGGPTAAKRIKIQ